MGNKLRKVVHDRALVRDVMTVGDVERIRDEMERAEARKLQPHFIRSFFLEAFALLGGAMTRTRAGQVRDHPCTRRASSPGPADRPALPCCADTNGSHSIRSLSHVRQTAGGVRLPGPPAPRRDDRPSHRALRHTASAGHHPRARRGARRLRNASRYRARGARVLALLAHGLRAHVPGMRRRRPDHRGRVRHPSAPQALRQPFPCPGTCRT